MTTQQEAIKIAREALVEIDNLIEETEGVYGLHLNGDNSPWDELEKGGRFERLKTLCEAIAALDAVKEPEPFYAFRRKGQDSFCTCDEARYWELSDKPNLFETAIFYREVK
jgi:hypothetical protein